MQDNNRIFNCAKIGEKVNALILPGVVNGTKTKKIKLVNGIRKIYDERVYGSRFVE